MKKEELQQKAILYQLLQKHLESLKQQVLRNESRFLEIQTTQHALKDFGKDEVNTALIPLGSGCYADAQITDTKKVLLDVGEGVVVKKTIKEAKVFLDEKEKEAGAVSEKLQNEANQVIKQINDIAVEIEEAQK
jgi:prefoldin alpha subunit